MTVVEKIHQLSDKLLCLGFEDDYGPGCAVFEKKRVLREQLARIKATCPTSWAEAIRQRR